MKGAAILTTALILGLAACSAPQKSRIEPRSSYPDAGTGNVPREELPVAGFLVIHTPKIRVDQEGKPYDLPNGGACDWSYLVPSGYSIHDRDGLRQTLVSNHSAMVSADEEPMEVVLAAGRYLVRLDRPEGGVQTFWVTIEAGRFTEVDPARLGPVTPSAGRDNPRP